MRRRTKQQQHDPEWHLNDPRTRKWLVQCGACQRVGYRADAPDRFFGRDHVVRYFEALDLDLVTGLCQYCRDLAGP